MVDSFDDIFENDPDGLLNVKPKATAQTETNASAVNSSRSKNSTEKKDVLQNLINSISPSSNFTLNSKAFARTRS